MNYLLDTCVLCEPTRKTPDKSVISWLDKQREDDLYLSVISLGEIAKGTIKLPLSRRRNRLMEWLHNDLPMRFGKRILDITPEICLKWGQICGEEEKNGNKVPAINALLTATAAVNSLVIVTRDVGHFSENYTSALNPWNTSNA